ncbi:MAG: LacI family transcriptional regulator [Ruminococcaceae bacterium]|nr:LacI family transcriptional regulator [Oscillospiraceae bacterium]
MSTIKDVAKLAGVSMSTVSKYINGGTIRPDKLDAIRNAIEVLDYRVNPFARSLKVQRNRTIGVLFPDIIAPFFGSILTSLDKVLREHGFHTLISCYGSNHGMERSNLKFLISNGIDGLIYVPEDLSCEEYEELTATYNVPTVLVDRLIQGVNTDAVLVDNSEAVYNAVSKLISKGHQKIAIISGPKSVFSAKERQIGYLRALTDHDVMYNDDYFVTGENTFTTGYQGCETLLALSDPPTAVVTTNYNITLGMITRLHEQGLHFPEEMDAVGFDCVEICTIMKPPLPVIYQPEAQIGQTAAQYLIERLDGYDGPVRQTRLPCAYIAD